MAVNIKMGVDMTGFKSGIADANAQLKTFDAQLKYAETAMKQAGNAEQGLVTKTNALEGKLKTQKQMLQQYTQQLQRMREAGVDPLSKDYQRLQAAMLNTKTSMMETQAALDGLDASQEKAADSAGKLVQSVNGIGKKISLDQVISGINSITNGLEKAAQKALRLGETIWNAVMDRAKWADDTQTMALMYGIDVDTFQRMQKLVTNGLDTTVDAMLGAQTKLKKGIGNGTQAVMDILTELKLYKEATVFDTGGMKEGGALGGLVTKDEVELFWMAGQALMKMSDAYDKEAAAQALFGRSWRELIPLFDAEHGGFASLEEYKKALGEVNVNSEEDVEALAELNDKIGELKGNLETLSTDILAKLAPALSEGADALNGLLTKILEYLETPEGKEMLQGLGDAISGLFEDLGKIDPDEVVKNFASLFEGVVNSFKWLTQNWESVKTALIGIAAGFGVLKIATFALNVKKVIDGLGNLIGKDTTAPVSPKTTGTDTGTGVSSLLVSSAVQKLGRAATSLSMADPTGLTAFAPQFIADNTTFFWRLTHGSTLGEAAEASWETIKASANEGMGNFRKYFTEDLPNAFWGVMGFNNAGEAAEAFSGVMKQTGQNLQTAGEWTFGDDITAEEAMALIKGEPIDVKIEPDAEGAAEDIQEQVGTVTIPAKLSVSGFVTGGGGSTGNVFMNLVNDFLGINGAGFANGLPLVPNDGLYLLHRGERVLTASENKNYTYNSNTYFGSVNLNNGLEIDALTESIARQNRRQRSGYGT